MTRGSERRAGRSDHGMTPGPAIEAPFPIVEQIPVSLSDEARARAARVAREFLQADPRLSSTSAFGAGVRAALDSGACLFIEDHHGIRLFERLGNLAYMYRALLLARPGDLVAIGLPRNRAFERYCAETLGLGEVEILEPAPRDNADSLAARCTRDAHVIERLAALSRQHDGLNIVPYMGTGGVWALAGVVSECSGASVRVAAPPPGLARRVNDKIWFSHCVDRLIGTRAIPAADSASGSALTFLAIWGVTGILTSRRRTSIG